MLEITGLTARYGGVAAVVDLDLRVAEGEMVAVLGHNGAGKTTLLRCAVGMHEQFVGEVRLSGRSILPGQVARNVQLGIGFVPQGHNVFPGLSVEQNLRLAGLRAGARDLGPVYDLFPDLAQRRRQAAHTLSGGQQQMLALGMAMVNRPRLLLLDEPSTGLAPALVQRVLEAVAAINARMGTTVVIVEQNVRAALRVARRVVVLRGGRLVHDGPASEAQEGERLWQWF